MKYFIDVTFRPFYSFWGFLSFGLSNMEYRAAAHAALVFFFIIRRLLSIALEVPYSAINSKLGSILVLIYLASAIYFAVKNVSFEDYDKLSERKKILNAILALFYTVLGFTLI